MIRINKDLTAVPASLQNPTTEGHWNTIIADTAWHDNDRYKQEDVRTQLRTIYNNKCAFCEKSLLDMPKHVEHFRPKQANAKLTTCDASFGYYWLCFSWDNLLLACGECNSPKNSCFDINGTRATYNRETFANIHNLSAGYDALEQPLFFNPEVNDPEPHLVFDVNSQLSSKNPQMQYTIERCSLNRQELLELRMIILNDLKRDLDEKRLLHGRDVSALMADVVSVFQSFCRNTLANCAFSAWRKYIMRHYSSFLGTENEKPFSLALRFVIERSIRPAFPAIFQ